MTCNVAVLAIGLLALAGVGGCDGSNEETTYENAGAICLVPTADTVAVSVQINACLAGHCRRATDVRCQVENADGRLTVTSHAKVIESNDGSACPESCDPAQPTCDFQVADGAYTIVHGADQATITFPLEGPVSLFGEVEGCEM